MNLFKLSLILVFIVSLASCKKDDDNKPSGCSQDDWVATYTGTETCDGDTENVTIFITESGTSAINIRVDFSGGSFVVYEDINLTDCTASASGTSSGFSFSINATLDANKLSITEVFDGDTCTYAATKN